MRVKNYVISGMMGLVVGDALGVPVEFMSREELMRNSIKDMREYGTHHQPKGTWSDDSSMAIATLDSLCSGIDYKDIMEKFSAWIMYGDYTPHGIVFDIGTSTSRAIINYGNKIEPLQCGGKTVQENGNGSLMRILPLALYLYGNLYKYNEDQVMRIVHQVSCLTHAHPRSQMGCAFYTRFIIDILQGNDHNSLLKMIQASAKCTFMYYQQSNYSESMKNELTVYQKMNEIENLFHVSQDNIHSTGYVVDTLEASVWCFITTNNYKDCVLKAVNLGGDTDTIAAIAGGLAGCYYGYDNIPKQWLELIVKRKWIEELCNKMQTKLVV